ncbi:universal stress protein [Cyanobacterium aponinum UTEX 3221]|uniref:universal stress protein n=1 Tax=Cyanobacterium aponinum TaxID=379064 RepID=UPI0016804C98|nr:universal stress protein [Cyanobacterium aponinum]MBD2395288.1 universal stress protein [Cyanobacterium aponinum FACHB-4101]WRL38647.1 universal stress protein [Cyanobacterium aponinum UTEX 3221]
MKNILVCTDGSIIAKNIYHYGAWFAKRLNAQINVLSVTDIRSQKVVSTGNFSGAIGLGASEDLLEKLVELEHHKAQLNHEKSKLILKTAKEILQAEGVINVNLISKKGFLVDTLHEFEGNNDLIVLGKRGENAEFASKHLGGNVERIIRSSHKPCLVVPLQFKPIERLLFAYDDSASCQKLLQFITSSPIFQGLELHLVTVTKDKKDQKAHVNLMKGQELATLAGFNPICLLIEGHPEEAIASYISENDISMLLMGAYGHNRIRQLVIGSTTIQILRSTQIPVFVFR